MFVITLWLKWYHTSDARNHDNTHVKICRFIFVLLGQFHFKSSARHIGYVHSYHICALWCKFKQHMLWITLVSRFGPFPWFDSSTIRYKSDQYLIIILITYVIIMRNRNHSDQSANNSEIIYEIIINNYQILD